MMIVRKLSVGAATVVLSVALLCVLALPALAAAPLAPGPVAVQAPIGATKATVQGVLDPGVEGHPGTYEFLYKKGPSSCQGEAVAPEAPGVMLGFENEAVPPQELTGLEPSTEYTVCLRAETAGGMTLGPPTTFTTAQALEAPTTSPANPVTATGATLLGALNPSHAAEAGEKYEFRYRPSASECEGEGENATPREEPAATNVGEAVKAEVSGLEPNQQYTACLLAVNAAEETLAGAPVTFTTGRLAPQVSEESFHEVNAISAQVTAQINTENQESTYYYLYGTPSAFQAGQAQQTPKVSLPASDTPAAAPATLTGLQATQEYHYQLIATNAAGETGLGEAQSFDALPTGEQGLPDSRVYEMVTPPNNQNAEVEIPLAVTKSEYVGEGIETFSLFQVSPDGSAVAYQAGPTTGGYGKSGQGHGNQYLATRSASGSWTQTNIQPPGRITGGYQGFSSNLSQGVLFAAQLKEGEPGLSSDAPGGRQIVLYKHSVDTGEEEAPYEPLYINAASFNRDIFGSYEVRNLTSAGYPVFAGASTDFGSLLFETNEALLAGSGPLETELENQVKKEVQGAATVEQEASQLILEAVRVEEEGNNQLATEMRREAAAKEQELEARAYLYNNNYLYDSREGALGLVNVSSEGKVVPDATFGGPPLYNPGYNEPDFSGAVSADGSRLYWTALAPGPQEGHVFLRQDGTSTVAVSAGAARYWTSAADGRYAFYTENGALYRFDAESETREAMTGVNAGLVGVVGASEDGSYVYFVAKGALASGATAQTCEGMSEEEREGTVPVTNGCNLYVSHAGDTRLVATLSFQDGSEVEPAYGTEECGGDCPNGDWQPGLGQRTASVTPGGAGLVFVSDRNLATVGYPHGYPHRGSSDQVYVFQADTGELFCASCASSGEALQGAFLSVSWSASYLPQWMADEGNRVFFDSFTPLVAQDTNGTQDVYEWERAGTGSCTAAGAVNGGCVYLLSDGAGGSGSSWFIGASESGDDVFIATRARLVPEDRNENFDLYDVRVDGVRPVAPPACTGTGCQGVPAPPPTFATPPSVTFAGVGNFPSPSVSNPVKPKGGGPKARTLTRAQKLAKALKACKEESGSSRRRCEGQARRSFGVKVKRSRKSTKGR